LTSFYFRYSLLVADIVKITADQPVLLTHFDKDFKDISWEMKDDDDVEVVKKEKASSKSSAVLKTKLRGEENV
jgi:nucleosome binding factor SPN SPT16 subunit